MRKSFTELFSFAAQDMKGKIRVFARCRPQSTKEITEKQNAVVAMPDEYTLEHPWKDEKKPRSYQFDRVFTPASTQEEVFEDVKYLMQSAIDGYKCEQQYSKCMIFLTFFSHCSVCIFAYGQTGSGKTHTVNGSPGNQGLTPRAIEELFHIIEMCSSRASFTLQVSMLELYQDNLQVNLTTDEIDFDINLINLISIIRTCCSRRCPRRRRTSRSRGTTRQGRGWTSRRTRRGGSPSQTRPQSR